MKKKLIFDTDAGADDLLALFFLLKNKKNSLDKIITSYGNYSLEMVANRVNRFLSENNFEANVITGSGKPLKRNYHFHGFDIHGDLWTDISLKPKTSLIKKIFIYKNITFFQKDDKNKYTYVSVGPLTNLSKVVLKSPDRIKEAFIMGGSLFYPGNATSVAEANFYWDPEAAKKVLTSNIKKYLIPLNLTDKIQFNRKHLRKLKSKSLKKLMTSYCDFYIDQKKEVFSGLNKEKIIYKGAAIHDLVTTVIAVYPNIATFTDQVISLESIENNNGLIIPVLRKEHQVSNNDDLVKLRVAVNIDIEKFWKIVKVIFEYN